MLDFNLAPANVCELDIGFEWLIEDTDLEVLGDHKASISADKASELWEKKRIWLKMLPWRDQRKQLPRHF